MTEITARLSTALADRYRIERELGAGGMATVYLAEDLKHHRKVAVKVLRPELAAVLGAERFVQEITTTANLQHPHILPLFDSGEADGFLFYVMPFIDGETLRDKLNRETQLGIDEAVRITTEVADALDYAHRHNVIHRDIKPENILLHDGRPMVADFGIALALSAAAGGRMTETGMSLGTPHYMSPEQATAEKDITHRSDIYSLGSVLYEMLTGEPPHTGGSAQAIIMKIVTEPADPVTKIRKSAPPHVAAATAKSLEKLAADRFESAAQFTEALMNPVFTVSVSHATAAVDVQTHGWWKRASGTLGVVVAILLATTLWNWFRPGAEGLQRVARFSVELPAAEIQLGNRGPSFAWSPDGARFAYFDTESRLWVRELDQLTAKELPGVSGTALVFAPNGQSVACICDGAVRTVSIEGGPPLTLEDTITGRSGLDWATDGHVYVQGVRGLVRIPETGGDTEMVLPRDTMRGDNVPSFVDVLPNARGALMIAGTFEQSSVAVVDFETGLVERVMPGLYARYATSGHIVAVQDNGTVLAAPFDQDAMDITGAAVLLTEIVSTLSGTRRFSRVGAQLALSENGDLLYRPRQSSNDNELVWVTRDGMVEPIDASWTGIFGPPTLSPDGTRLALSILQNDEEHIYIKTLDRGPLDKLTLEGFANLRPAWTPDGRAVAFSSDRGAGRDLYVKRVDGSTPAEPLLDRDRGLFEVRFSADGEWLLYREGVPGNDLYAVRQGADSAPVTIVATGANELTPVLSPDGRWVAYTSNESGQSEVYVRPFPNTDSGRRLVSINGGTEPMWARSGRELFYKGGGELISVEILPDTALVLGERQSLFSLDGFVNLPARQMYDVAADDRRFVMVRSRAGDELGDLILVLNFFEELKAKVGNE